MLFDGIPKGWAMDSGVGPPQDTLPEHVPWRLTFFFSYYFQPCVPGSWLCFPFFFFVLNIFVFFYVVCEWVPSVFVSLSSEPQAGLGTGPIATM